jgi:hypothetical protein
VLFTVDPHKDFVNVEGVAITLVLAFQSAGIDSAELDTPKTDRFAADGDTSLGKEIFNVTMAQIESVVEPDGIGDDVRWESVSFVCAHGPILAI